MEQTVDEAMHGVPRCVLHVEAGRHLYGGAQQVLYLMEGLARQGIDNRLACPPGAGIAGPAREFATVIELPMRGDLDVGLVGRLRRCIDAAPVDLVHLHSRRGADILGGLAARRSGVPAVLSRRVDNAEPAWLCRWKYGLYDRVIAISEAIRAVLVSQGVGPDTVTCVPSAVDAGPWMAPPDKAAFRAEFSLPGDAPVIGMAAQFIPRKGHNVLLDALPAVLERHPRCRVLLFGRGPLVQTVQDELGRRNLAGSVQLAGFRDDLPRWLPCLDVLVHPASAEGLGVVLLQASASAVPVVSCRAGGIPEAVSHDRTGLLVPPGQPAELAAALTALLDDPARARRMGAAGRRQVLERHSVEAMVAGNLAVYREVLRERAGGDDHRRVG